MLSDSCEVISLGCVILLMDTVNVSSRVRTIAYRMYEFGTVYTTSGMYTPSSDS